MSCADDLLTDMATLAELEDYYHFFLSHEATVVLGAGKRKQQQQFHLLGAVRSAITPQVHKFVEAGNAKRQGQRLHSFDETRTQLHQPSSTMIIHSSCSTMSELLTLLFFFVHHWHLTVDAQSDHGGSFLRRTQGEAPSTPPYCGCNDCDDAVWDLNVVDFNGDYTCGARITWVMEALGQTERDACILVAANEFPADCGKACNPLRCDGNDEPYVIQDFPPVVSGDLTVEADMYCYPSYNARARWSNVWGNNFIMEVKETEAPMQVCDPGANHFTTQTVSYDETAEELKLEFKYQGNRWMGAEVRLVLPEANMPFHYGTYEWSVKSVQIIDTRTGAVTGTTLPPRLVLGLFTWDTTEDFAIRENRNHEVDIEISNFGDIGGPDVNFLVQPPGRPQQAKLYSGGTTGSYDQSGHTWKFDWNPNNITWYSTAAGGLSHIYSSDIILDYASPPWLQCMPADVEIRMNLWSLDGINPQLDLAEHERIEVIISNFAYTASGETHVQNGGSCTKHCQCAEDSECDAGTCRALSTSSSTDAPTSESTSEPTSAPTNEVTSEPPISTEDDSTEAPTESPSFAATLSPTFTPTFSPTWTQTEVPTRDPTGPSAACSASPACSHLANDCCPNYAGDMLACCYDNAPPPAPAPGPSPPNSPMPRACSANAGCVGLAGNCCPTKDGVMLYCCYD